MRSTGALDCRSVTRPLMQRSSAVILLATVDLPDLRLRRRRPARTARGAGGLHVKDRQRGFLCEDGSTAPTVDAHKFDDATLTGTHTSLHNAICGGVPAGVTKTPFTLMFSEPLPIPVDCYPLDCEPGRLRLCR